MKNNISKYRSDNNIEAVSYRLSVICPQCGCEYRIETRTTTMVKQNVFNKYFICSNCTAISVISNELKEVILLSDKELKLLSLSEQEFLEKQQLIIKRF